MTTDAETTLNDLIARVGRVRRWLLALSALKIAALGLASVSLYIGLYAWIDHHMRFGRFGRVSAFVLFVAMIAAGLYYVIRVLRRDMTYAHAANHVEDRHSFDQQLVAAVEYYEGKGDYPYSKVLAKQLVLHVDRAAEGCRFDATIDKWQGYLLSGVIFLCLLVVGLFVRQNVLYVSSYLARLVRPFSAIQPMPAAALEATTGDIVTGPDAPVTLAAAIKGRAPEDVTLVLTRRDPNDANDATAASPERIQLTPVQDSQGKVTVTATRSFDTTGCFEYRFETPEGASESHTIRVSELPTVKSMRATITPPGKEGMPPIRPYEQELSAQTLEVLPGSRVEVKVQATTPLREATTVAPNGQATTQSLDGADTFGFQVTADASSSVEFNMVSTDGLAGGAPQELRIALKSDDLPQFKLISPEGDYLATDVASVPIVFEVTDDFGLDWARLVGEFPDHGPVVLASVSAQGSRQTHLTHTLELEQYDLHVGDSILFYATARDIDTGHRPADANGCSEVYFIEIRPYRQYWNPQAGGQPSSQPGPIAEDLITILEYTRGILKRMWPLVRAPQVTADDRPTLDALGADVRYCADGLARIRDDPEAGFNDSDKAVLSEVIDDYGRAEQHLDRQDAKSALPPQRNAYRTLRKFIDELHMKWDPSQSGQSVPQQTPERVKLQEQPEEPQMEKERIESRLKEMQQKIDTLTRQQQSLKADLTEVMQQEKQARLERPSAGQQPSGGEPQPRQGQDQGAKPSAGQGSQAGQTEQTQAGSQGSSAQSGGSSQQSGRSTGEGKGGDGSSGAGEQASEGQRGLPSQGSYAAAEGPMSPTAVPSTTGGKAGSSSDDTEARLRMLQAKQKALREQVAQLNAELGRLPVPEYSAQGTAQDQAQEHLNEAVDAMKRSEEKLADARYGPPASSEAEGEMVAPADSAARQLAEAGKALGRGRSGDGQQSAAEKAQEMAEQLAEAAEAYDESLSEAEKQRMLAQLAAAERMLENMAGPQWTTISAGGGPSSSLVYTKDGHMTPAEAARMLARQFWSVALESRQRERRPVEEEPSDVEFFEAENEFFESAAAFRRQRVER